MGDNGLLLKMFDTRSKIVSVEAFLDYAQAQPTLKIVAALLDPLYAPHVQALGEIAGDGKLMIIVETLPSPLLDARARAELAAALELVELVTIADATASRQLHAQLGSRIIDQRPADAARYTGLAAHVRQRNNV